MEYTDTHNVDFLQLIKTPVLAQPRAPESSGFDSRVSGSDLEHSTGESLNLPGNDYRKTQKKIDPFHLPHSEDRCINCMC